MESESLHCSPEATTTLLIGYTRTQKLKLKGKKRKNTECESAIMNQSTIFVII